MADDSAEEKVFEPSSKKLRKLRDEGQIPRSQEITGAISLLVLLIYFIVARDEIFGRLAILVRDIPLMQPRDFETRVAIAMTMTIQITFDILFPFFLIVFISVVVATMIDTGGFLFHMRPPNFSQFNPANGFKNMFTLDAFLRLIRGIIKIPVFFIIVWVVNRKHVNDAFWSPTCGLPCVYEVLAVITLKIIIIGMLMLFLSAVLDFVITRWKFNKDQMMTLTEMKQEQKEDSGSPDVRRARNRIRQENQQTAGLVGINNASVVFKTKDGNVLAISYKPDLLGVPIVAARGTGESAIEIERRAKESKIPFFDDPALAAELYEKGRVGNAIPKETFSTVARALMQLGLVKR
jgi:flagellar biosynthesis protein FlhB